MILRHIETRDDPAVALVIRNSLREFNAAKPGTVYFDPSTDHLTELFTCKRSSYFVIEDKNEIAGGAGYYPTAGLDNNTCELVKMYVAQNFRGNGYGQTLLHKCLAEAKNAGYKKIYLESMPELTNAISMYRKNGFDFIDGPLGNSGHGGCSVFMIRGL